jgi:hypothetical protein
VPAEPPQDNPPVDQEGFLDILAQPWRVAILFQCGFLGLATFLLICIPGKYFDLQTARDMKDYYAVTSEENGGKKKSLHREVPEVKWNVYSKFGSPSVVIGLDFAKKVEIAHAAHNDYEDSQVEDSIAQFQEKFIAQRKSLLKNPKYMLASCSMAAYCFSVTGLQYFFTDYI